MQFLEVTKDLTMSALRKIVGAKNIDNVLSYNQLPTVPDIGRAIHQKYDEVSSTTNPVTNQRKMTILNSVSTDADVFEIVALLDEDGWKYIAVTNAIPFTIRMPETVVLPNSVNTIGGTADAISRAIYDKAMGYLLASVAIDPIIFNTYDSPVGMTSAKESSYFGSLSYFNIPWGQITLFSSIANESVELPVYPEEYSDGYQSNYDTMPDMLYQYEPWYVYKGSGPREVPLTFKMHRDMWTGDHRDGKCNELIRFCQAQCFPDYQGAAVNTALVTLYIAGKPYIRGILKEEKHTYSGPLGLDNFPLYVEMILTFTEISAIPLNYNTVRRKGLIS